MFRPPTEIATPDLRDEEERSEVSAILEPLPASHPAKIAHERGEDTRMLARLVENADLAARLTKAFLAGYNRMLRQHKHFRP